MNIKKRINDNIKKLNRECGQYKNSSVVIFGTASCGNMAYETFKSSGEKIEAFIDNNQEKNNRIIADNIKCYLPEKFISEASEPFIYIIAAGNHLYDILKKQVKDLLEKYNKKGAVFTFNEYVISQNFDRIKNVYKYLSDEKSKQTYEQIILARLLNCTDGFKDIFEPVQYFCLPEFCQSGMADEIFADCGAYVGDTLEKYLFYCGYLFKKIYAFEPVEQAFQALSTRAARLKKEWCLKDDQIECINKGVGDIDKKLYLAEGTIDIGGSLIKESYSDGNSECEVCSVDKTIDGKIDFIKADIEGYELKMLKGAEKHIKTYKPKIAVCIYHSPSDLFTIAEYIKKLVPEYKMKLRHHSTCFYESVLYCYI